MMSIDVLCFDIWVVKPRCFHLRVLSPLPVTWVAHRSVRVWRWPEEDVKCDAGQMKCGEIKDQHQKIVFFAALNVYIHDLLSEYLFKLSTVYIIAGVLLNIQGDFSSDPRGVLFSVFIGNWWHWWSPCFWRAQWLGTTDSSSSGTLPILGELANWIFWSWWFFDPDFFFNWRKDFLYLCWSPDSNNIALSNRHRPQLI